MHPALPQLESGLADWPAALQRGDLDAMHAALCRSLDALAAITRDGLVPRQQREAVPWDADRALQLVWDVLACLRAGGCHAFPYAGTLLGLARDGRLLAHDKDADLALWLEELPLAAALLAGRGFQRATDVPPFSNVATFVDPATGYTVDLFGLQRFDGRIEGGAWLAGRPASHQRVLDLPWVDLATRASPAGEVWWPADADALLTAFYGDWRTPDPEWDTLVANRALRERNFSWECWALRSLCTAWLQGDLGRTRRRLAVIEGLAHASGTQRLAFTAWRDALDAGLALQHRRSTA